MNNVVYTVILFFLVVVIIKWKSIEKYCIAFLKVSHNSYDRNCSCAKTSSHGLNNMKSNKQDISYKQSDVENYGENILENIGYFVASNDEKKTSKYYPTSLQDVDPNGLA